MFNLYILNKNCRWINYYESKEINLIYNKIEILNCINEVEMYRIDIDDRVFAFLDNSEYKLNYMKEHYNTNEKCKPRYASDEYDSGFIKTKRR